MHQFTQHLKTDQDRPATAIRRASIATLTLGLVLSGCASPAPSSQGGTTAAVGSSGATVSCTDSLTPWLLYTAYEVNGATRSAKVAKALADSVPEGQNPYAVTNTLYSASYLSAAQGLDSWATEGSECPGATDAQRLAGALRAVASDEFQNENTRGSVIGLGLALRQAAGIQDVADSLPDGGPVPADGPYPLPSS